MEEPWVERYPVKNVLRDVECHLLQDIRESCASIEDDAHLFRMLPSRTEYPDERSHEEISSEVVPLEEIAKDADAIQKKAVHMMARLGCEVRVLY